MVARNAGIKQCAAIFGKIQKQKKFGGFCKPFRKGKKGKVDTKTLFRKANALLKICVPGGPQLRPGK